MFLYENPELPRVAMERSPKSMSANDWQRKIQPALESSVADANQVITNTQDIQKWLQTASLEASSQLQGMADATAQMHAYRALLDSFLRQHPELLEAVRTLTHGAATIGIDWRPMAPQHSQVELDFETDADIDLFLPIEEAGAGSIHAAFETMERHLPKSDAYPGHTHEIGAVLAKPGRKVGIILRKKTSKDGSTRRSYALEAPSYEDVDGLTREQAVEAVRRYFQEEAGAASG